MFHIFFLLIFLNLNINVVPYKILSLFQYPGKSHVDVFLPLMKGLALKGHEVTVISYIPLKETVEGYREIILENAQPLIDAIDLKEHSEKSRWHKYLEVFSLDYISDLTCKAGLESKRLQNFLKEDNHFDLILIELFNSDCFMAVAEKFNAPKIGLSSCSIMPWSNSRFANPDHPAYIPNIIMQYTDKLTFLERLENTIFTVFSKFYYEWIMMKQDENNIRKHLVPDLSSLKQIAYNISLLLVNTHYTLNLPRPLVPAVIEMAGIHLAKPKNLPENLEKWITDAKDGVIYFSLGSMIKGHTFPEEKTREFLKAFKRLPQRVLWKWENESMPGKPDNVMIQKWMPQLDILCHPNVHGFISHGGLLGTIEAVHCGTPAIVMPQYGDQFTNAKALEANGGGVIMKLNDATEEIIYNSIKKILDPNFRKGAQELSERFRDRPMSPLDTAIYWVEYVARHKGAPFMRTAAVNMPFYQYFLLDVFGFLALVTVIFVTIACWAIKAISRRLKTAKKQETKVKRN